MKKILFIFLVVISLMLFACKSKENDKTPDPTINNNDNINMDNQLNKNDEPENKHISSFEVLENIDVNVYNEYELKITYDIDKDVRFVLTSNSDNIEITQLKYKALNIGEYELIVTEELSKISKSIKLNVYPAYNKIINYYNGYYLLNNCLYVNSLAYMNYTSLEKTLKNNYYISLSDDLELKAPSNDILTNISNNFEFENAFLIEDNKDFTHVLLEKDNQLYLCIVSRKDTPIAIWSLEYTFTKPIEKEVSYDPILNLPYGLYLNSGCVYVFNYVEKSNELSVAFNLSNEFKYKQMPIDYLEKQINSMNTDKSYLPSSIIFNVELKQENIKSLYNVSDGTIDSEHYIAIDNNNDVFYILANNIKIYEAYKCTYLPELERVIKDEKEYVSVEELVGFYKYKDLIYAYKNQEKIYSLLVNTNNILISKDTKLIKREDTLVKYDSLEKYDVYELDNKDKNILNQLLVNEDEVYLLTYIYNGFKDTYELYMEWSIEKAKTAIEHSKNNITGLNNGSYYTLVRVDQSLIPNKLDLFELVLNLNDETELSEVNINDYIPNFDVTHKFISNHLDHISDYNITKYFLLSDLGLSESLTLSNNVTILLGVNNNNEAFLCLLEEINNVGYYLLDFVKIELIK